MPHIHNKSNCQCHTYITKAVISATHTLKEVYQSTQTLGPNELSPLYDPPAPRGPRVTRHEATFEDTGHTLQETGHLSHETATFTRHGPHSARRGPIHHKTRPTQRKTRPTQRKTRAHTSQDTVCLLYTSPSPRDEESSRMPSSA